MKPKRLTEGQLALIKANKERAIARKKRQTMEKVKLKILKTNSIPMAPPKKMNLNKSAAKQSKPARKSGKGKGLEARKQAKQRTRSFLKVGIVNRF